MTAPRRRLSLALQLGLRVGAALLLTLLAGMVLTTQPWPGMALAMCGIGLLVHTLVALQRSLSRAFGDCTSALQQLAQGRNSFRLDAHGLPGLDPLLLAIDDLREAVEPFDAVGLHRGAPLPAAPRAATGALRPAWLNG